MRSFVAVLHALFIGPLLNATIPRIVLAVKRHIPRTVEMDARLFHRVGNAPRVDLAYSLNRAGRCPRG